MPPLKKFYWNGPLKLFLKIEEFWSRRFLKCYFELYDFFLTESR